MAEGDRDWEGDDGGAAQLAVHALPHEGQHQQRDPVGQQCPKWHASVRHNGKRYLLDEWTHLSTR